MGVHEICCIVVRNIFIIYLYRSDYQLRNKNIIFSVKRSQIRVKV